MDFMDAVNILKKEPAWQVFREKRIEKAINDIQELLVRPCKDYGDVLAIEREKGAMIALKGLLFVFDIELPPTREKDKEDEPSAGQVTK